MAARSVQPYQPGKTPSRSTRLPINTTLLVLSGSLLGMLAAMLPLLLTSAIVLIGIGFAQPIAMLAITLTVAPLKTLIETEARLSLDLGQVAFVLTVAACGLQRLLRREPILPRAAFSGASFALLLMIIGAGFSLFVAESPAQTVSELIKWLEILVLAGVVAGLCESNPHNLRLIVAVILAAGCTQALIGLYQFLGGSGAPHLWILDNRFFRAFGTYGQPNPFGAHMELALALGGGVAVGVLNRQSTAIVHQNSQNTLTGTLPRSFLRPVRIWMRGVPAVQVLLSVIPLTILAMGLLSSWSRGAWLGFGAGVTALIFFAPRRRWVGAALVFGGAGSVLMAGALGLLPGSLVARLSDFSQDLTGIEDVRGQEISNERYAVLERLAHWQAAVSMANDNPWLGVGFGNYEVAYPRYALMNWKYPLGHAHNYYLNMLAETGVIGLVAYIAGWLMIVLITIQRLKRTSGFERGVALGLIAVWAALSVHSLFDKLYVNNLFLHIGAMVGLIQALRPQSGPLRTQ